MRRITKIALLRLLKNPISDKFTLHPRMHDMTYIQHMRFSLRTALTFARLFYVAMIHAIFPWVWKKEASNRVSELAIQFRLRRAR
jgi:hypothetical protein